MLLVNMNSRIINEKPAVTIRNLMLDDQWIVTIQDEIDGLPVAASEFVTPYEMGRQDALDGVCDPSRHYGKLGQIEEYLIGWNDAVSALADDVETVSDAYEHGQRDYDDGLPAGVFRYYESRAERQDYVYGYRQAKVNACSPQGS